MSWSTLKEVTILDVPLLQGKARIQAVCTKAISHFGDIACMGRSWSGSIGIDGVAYLRKNRRCPPYLGTKLEEAQLHCYLESCACVAAATTTACAIRQHDDHLRLVSAQISGGVHSSSFGGTKIFQVCNSIYLAL